MTKPALSPRYWTEEEDAELLAFCEWHKDYEGCVPGELALRAFGAGIRRTGSSCKERLRTLAEKEKVSR